MEQGSFKKNDIVRITIEDIGNDGEGIGKADGYILFVKDAVIGDVIKARITKCKKNYGYARVEKVVTPSPFRVEPKCAFHRQCGGCQIQAMSYERQLAYKQNKVRNHLQRIGGFAPGTVDAVMEPIVGMDEPWHYRNKAQYPVGYDKGGNLVAGFYAGRTHDIIANTDCPLGPPENNVILEAVLSYMRENDVSAYRESTGEGLVRHVLIRTGFASGEIMVCLVINGRKLPGEDKLEENDIDTEDALDFKGTQIKNKPKISAKNRRSIQKICGYFSDYLGYSVGRQKAGKSVSLNFNKQKNRKKALGFMPDLLFALELEDAAEFVFGKKASGAITVYHVDWGENKNIIKIKKIEGLFSFD